MARLIMSALKHAGHNVSLVSQFRSWNGKGDNELQNTLEKRAENVVKRLIDQYSTDKIAFKPDIWLTYHVYYKAPDLLGPIISQFLGILYVIAEASHAPKRAVGKWANGHASAEQAIRRADHIISLNPADTPCITPLLKKSAAITPLMPFLPAKHPIPGKSPSRDHQKLLETNGLDPKIPTLITVAMMRDGDKYASYCALAEALAQISSLPWQLLVIGDGPTRRTLEQQFGSLGNHRVRFLGALQNYDVASTLCAADLFVWPAINEAYGMAILEAQAAGLPVIAGNSGGVGQIVRDGKTGILTKAGNIKDFADAVALLLSESARRSAMGKAAKQVVKRDHSFEQASETLDSILIEPKKGKIR